eukprot:632208-Prorocentrum_minimum.AAC.1
MLPPPTTEAIRGTPICTNSIMHTNSIMRKHSILPIAPVSKHLARRTPPRPHPGYQSQKGREYTRSGHQSQKGRENIPREKNASVPAGSAAGAAGQSACANASASAGASWRSQRKISASAPA